MIVPENRSWLGILFAFHGSSLASIWPRIAAVTVFSVVVTCAEYWLEVQSYSLTTTPFTLIGIAMAIFLAFRNSESYNRFWEGRKLWGELVNTSRSLTRQSLTLIGTEAAEEAGEVEAVRRRIVHATIGYVHALRHELRDTNPDEDLQPYLSDEERQLVDSYANLPMAILQCIGRQVRDAWRRGYLHELHVPVLENSLVVMTDVQGGCERIKNTPLPFSYSVLLHRIVAVYCFALPFGLLDTAGVLTPVVVCLISYAFLGLDSIGRDVEQPFEMDDNDVPLAAICRTIEIDLLQAVGAEHVPEPLQPVNGVLN